MKEGRVVECSLLLRNALERLACCHLSQPHSRRRVDARYGQAQFQGVPSTSSMAVVNDFVGSCGLDTEFGGCAYNTVSIESQWTKNIAKVSPDNVFSFYPRMFNIICKGDIDSMELTKITMILMFNEALSRHAVTLMYLSLYKVNPVFHLTSIMRLYQKVLVHAQRCFQYSDFREMLCVLVAATNNYGHIVSQLLLFDETRDCISNMIHFLSISDEDSFLPDDLRLFLEGVCIFFEGRYLCIAPAA
jgi:hypothetical protein